MPGRKLHIKCYLEGIEVPISGVQISINVNQASSAEITIPPTDKAFLIRPRTRVHIFWFDDTSSNWYLIWEGEVLALGFSKSTNGRAVSLSCADLSNYWDYTLKMLYQASSGASLGARSETIFYGNEKREVTILPSSAQEGLLAELTKDQNLPLSVYNFLQKMTNSITYYSKINDRLKINKQIKIMPDNKILSLLKGGMFKALINNLMGNHGDLASIREIINSFCSMSIYTHVPIGAPSIVQGIINSFVLKPNLFGCIPPKCNVVFPDICSNISYSRSFMNEPTRMMIQAQWTPGRDGKIRPLTRTAPAYLYQKLKNLTNEAVLKSFTDEELEKGIIPREINLPFPELFAMMDSNRPEGQDSRRVSINYLNQYGEYMFQMARYGARSLSFSTELNPWMVCGFPCAVFDVSRSYIANVDSISHVIQADGGGYTHVSCSLAMELSKYSKDDDSPYVPPWNSESYRPSVISDTYKSLFGCAAMGEEYAYTETATPNDMSTVASGSASALPPNNGTETAKKVNLSAIGQYLFDPSNPQKSEYHLAAAAGNSYSFADGYRRRALVRMKDVFDFYGFSTDEQIPPTKFDGDSLDYKSGIEASVNPDTISKVKKYRQAIIQSYVDEINASSVFDGR